MNTPFSPGPASAVDRIRHDLVGLRMPRALEALDHVVRRLKQGELSALEAIDILLSEELTLRENSCIKTALRMGRLATIKTLSGFDFTFQPSLDRDRILTLAQLGFVERSEVIHFLGPPGTGKMVVGWNDFGQYRSTPVASLTQVRSKYCNTRLAKARHVIVNIIA